MRIYQDNHTRETQSLKLLFTLIFGGLIAFGSYMLLNADEDDRAKKSFEINKRVIIGEVSGIKQEKRIAGGRNPGPYKRGEEYTVYPMTYKFNFNQISYKSEDRYDLFYETIYLAKKDYKILKAGSRVNIYFDPTNPNFNYYEYEDKFQNRYTGGTKIYAMSYMVSGLFFVLLVFYLVFDYDPSSRGGFG